MNSIVQQQNIPSLEEEEEEEEERNVCKEEGMREKDGCRHRL